MINMSMFLFSLDIYLEIIELAQKNGKKEGDSMQEEFEIVLKQNPDQFTYLGDTTDDLDLICGNLRERGLKILNLKEIERRKQNEKGKFI